MKKLPVCDWFAELTLQSASLGQFRDLGFVHMRRESLVLCFINIAK